MNVALVPLAEIATIERDAVAAHEIEQGSLYVGLEHIDSSGALVDVTAVNAGELASNKFRFGARHILYGKLRPYLKKTARPDFGGICSTDILPILPGPRVNKDYLFHYLRHPKIVEEAVLRCAGANLPRISPRDIETFAVPLPPPAEQRRIAAILDKADAIRRKRKETIALTEELLRSAFVDQFGDPVTNPRGWRVKPLSDLAVITTGNTPSRSAPEYFGDAIEWIKSDNINTRSHFLTQAAEGLSAQGRSVARIAPAGSTLMTCIAGSPACIGNVALADREVSFNQQINAVTPRDGVDSRFLYVLLLVGKRLVQAASTNSMKGMVSKGKLEEVLVPAPPSKLQAGFGELFERLLNLSRRQEIAEQDAQRLFDSILQRTFAGGHRA